MKVLKFTESALVDSKSFENAVQVVKMNLRPSPPIVVMAPLTNISKMLAEMSQLTKTSKEAHLDLLKKIEEKHFDLVKYFVNIKRQAKVIANLKMILNELEEILHGVYLLWELSPRTQDHIHTFGSALSAYLMSEILKEQDIDNVYISGRDIIKTDNAFGAALILESKSDELIQQKLANLTTVAVVSGGIGSTLQGESTSLGKSGVTLTGAYLAATLKSECFEVYNTRNGIYNSDKRWVPDAYSLPHLTYNEALEMANFDMNVICPPAFEPAFTERVPVLIKNLQNLHFQGTRIDATIPPESKALKCTSAISNVSLITIQGAGMIGVAGVAARFFSTLASIKVNIVFITQSSSEQSITVAVVPEQGDPAKTTLENEFKSEIENYRIDRISLKHDMSIVAIIGENMKNTPGIAGKIFTVLGEYHINIAAIAQGSSELNISIVIKNEDLKKVLNIFQSEFFN